MPWWWQPDSQWYSSTSINSHWFLSTSLIIPRRCMTNLYLCRLFVEGKLQFLHTVNARTKEWLVQAAEDRLVLPWIDLEDYEVLSCTSTEKKARYCITTACMLASRLKPSKIVYLLDHDANQTLTVAIPKRRAAWDAAAKKADTYSSRCCRY